MSAERGGTCSECGDSGDQGSTNKDRFSDPWIPCGDIHLSITVINKIFVHSFNGMNRTDVSC